MNLDTASESEPEAPDSEHIVIPRWLLITVGVGFTAFLLGLGAGFGLALVAYNRGAEDATAALEAALRSAGQAQAAAQPTQPPSRLDNVSVDDDPALGPNSAPVVIVEFSDFRCPYCKRFHDETLPVLLEQYSDRIRLVYRDFPVVGGETDAEAAECADEQGKFWPYHDALFENFRAQSSVDDYVALAENLGLDTDAFRECLESGVMRQEIIGDASDAQSYGVTGTPTFFINGVRVIGAQPLSVFQAVIDQELEGR